MVKIISHHCDGVRVINCDNQCCKFTDVSDLRSCLLSDFENFIHEDTFQFGYIQPGHGAKGRQVLVDNNTALDQMYRAHKKNLLILWLKVTKRATKRVATIVQQKGTKKPCADTTNTSGVITRDIEKICLKSRKLFMGSRRSMKTATLLNNYKLGDT